MNRLANRADSELPPPPEHIAERIAEMDPPVAVQAQAQASAGLPPPYPPPLPAAGAGEGSGSGGGQRKRARVGEASSSSSSSSSFPSRTSAAAPATAPAALGEEERKEEEEREEDGRCYAVRVGRNVRRCLFFRWEDCAPEVEGGAEGGGEGGNGPYEYEAFDDAGEARAYLLAGPGGGGGGGGGGVGGGAMATGRVPAPAPPLPPTLGRRLKLRAWDRMFLELSAYRDREGHCLVPTGGVAPPSQAEPGPPPGGEEGEGGGGEGGGVSSSSPAGASPSADATSAAANAAAAATTKLARWVSRQRLEYRYMEEGKPTHMTAERAARLASLGFAFRAWDGRRTQGVPEERWREQFRDGVEGLLRFKADTGHCDVPANHPHLGRWVHQVRALVQRRNEGRPSDPLTDEQHARLLEVGFVLRAKRGPKPGRRKEADASAQNSWEAMYGQLEEFRTRSGHCLVPQNPYTPLRGWVLRQRAEYKRLRDGERTQLSARRVQRLNDLGFEWRNKKTLKWDERYEHLRAFKERVGHCIVPRNYDQHGAAGLGKWVAQQRHAHKLLAAGRPTTLTRERADRLTELGMVWSVIRQPANRTERLPWEERLNHLLRYREKNGHTMVPQNHPGGLGSWVHQQRTHYVYMKTGRKSLMTPDKAVRLTDAGFVFSVKKGKTWTPQGSATDVENVTARAEAAGLIRKSADGGGYQVVGREGGAGGGEGDGGAVGAEAGAGGDAEAGGEADADGAATANDENPYLTPYLEAGAEGDQEEDLV